jgi:hypothetical protein
MLPNKRRRKRDFFIGKENMKVLGKDSLYVA